MHMCNADSQKRSAKGSNFKEDDRALPLYKLLLYDVAVQFKHWYSIRRYEFSISMYKDITYFFLYICLASGGGCPLYPEFLQYYTMFLQRPRNIVGDAGFEPGTPHLTYLI